MMRYVSFNDLKMDNFRKQTGKHMLIGWLIFPGQEFTYAGHGIQLAPNKEIVYTDVGVYADIFVKIVIGFTSTFIDNIVEKVRL